VGYGDGNGSASCNVMLRIFVGYGDGNGQLSCNVKLRFFGEQRDVPVFGRCPAEITRKRAERRRLSAGLALRYSADSPERTELRKISSVRSAARR